MGVSGKANAYTQYYWVKPLLARVSWQKNWLCIGCPGAGQRCAILNSLIVSCRRHAKDPRACLRDFLTRLPRMANHDNLWQLIPARWSPPLHSPVA